MERDVSSENNTMLCSLKRLCEPSVYNAPRYWHVSMTLYLCLSCLKSRL